MDPSAYAAHAAVEQRHWWFRGRRRIARYVIASLGLRPDARVLELGCGTGGNLPMLRKLGAVVAVEPDDGARDVARGRVDDVTLLASVDELSGPAFDAMFAFDVLEHLADPVPTLRRMRAFAVPGAPLVATVPQHPWLFGAHDRYLHHQRRYTEAALRRDLAAGGFFVESMGSINALSLPVAGAVRAIEAVRDLVGRPAQPRARGMGIPPWPINELLVRWFAAEARLPLPTGLALLVVARTR